SGQSLTREQQPQSLETVVLSLAGERACEPFAPCQRRVDLLARVVILELHTYGAHAGQPAHGAARVGCHQEREVRRALRRWKPQGHEDIPSRIHLTRADEPKRCDRLVELWVMDGAERVEDALAERRHAVSTSCASSFAPGVPASGGNCSPAGTSIP